MPEMSEPKFVEWVQGLQRDGMTFELREGQAFAFPRPGATLSDYQKRHFAEHHQLLVELLLATQTTAERLTATGWTAHELGRLHARREAYRAGTYWPLDLDGPDCPPDPGCAIPTQREWVSAAPARGR